MKKTITDLGKLIKNEDCGKVVVSSVGLRYMADCLEKAYNNCGDVEVTIVKVVYERGAVLAITYGETGLKC